MTSILVVEDEPRIAAIVGDYLRRAGFGVEVALLVSRVAWHL